MFGAERLTASVLEALFDRFRGLFFAYMSEREIATMFIAENNSLSLGAMTSALFVRPFSA